MNKMDIANDCNQKYSEIIAFYVILRESNQSHEQAVEGLKDLMDSFNDL